MCSFLKGHRLWRYVTGEIQAPIRSKDEDDTKFADRLEDWDCKNHQIITWFRHSTVSSIHQQFGRYENAKDVWDLLSHHYTTAGLSHEYQLWGLLVNMKQAPRQPINEFLSGMQSIWDQLEQSTHIVKDPADAAILATKRDQFHLIQFLMALTSEFELVRAALLQQVPLPTLEFAMSRLLSHETRLRTLQLHHPDAVLAITARPSSSSSSRNGPKYCKNCHKQGHLLSECSTIQCQYCHKIGHIVYNCLTKPPKPGQSGILPRPVNHSVAVATEDSPSDPSLLSVPDPRTNQVLGTGRRVGRMFELTSLHLPSTSTPPPSHVAHTASIFPLSLWHLRLGEAALTIVYTINRLPSSTLQNVTPFERLYDPSTILPISPSDSLVSPLAPPLAVDPILDQTSDLPLVALPTDSPASPQEPTPPVDLVTDQTPLLPLRRSDRQAMTKKLQALEKTHTWNLVDLPRGKSAISCKWIYKIKTKSNGSIERLLAIAAVHQWPLFQMDVKNAFLNGDLTKEVYMQAPPGYSDYPDKVFLLRRAFYGLKKTPRAWFVKFSSIVHQFGISSSSYDTTLFIRRSDKGMILLLLYVDDMIITGDDHSGISDFKLFLHQQFEMKDLGHLSYFLGLEVFSDSISYYLSQAKYASDLLSRAGLTDTKVVSTPLEMNARLTPLDGTPLSDATLYRQLVGSLVYLTVTRPDIAHAVHLVSQFLSALHFTHYAAVIHILRYIKGTMFHGLHFSAHSTLDLCAYSDADWAGDPTDHHSTTGFCFFLGDSLISWCSKKQNIVSHSRTEAEYHALADITSELLALRWLLEDMGLTHSSPIVIHCDNHNAIQITHNDVFHECTKHIEIDCHLVRHHLSVGILHLLPVCSSDQTADIFTKTFPPGRFRDLVSKLKMASVRPP
uniref:CCHC-type domain-containing protein n=1 Tax=Fagus sylvatica TaxID=28930 RepID=A0A2N9FVG4_FAGSY